MDPVDHDGHQVEPERSAVISADSVAATKRRDTADSDTERVLLLMASPMGSRPIW
jgi:hypothetical protein